MVSIVKAKLQHGILHFYVPTEHAALITYISHPVPSEKKGEGVT